MADYKLRPGGVIRNLDGANIPDTNSNRDWREYQRWLKIPGNVPDPADPPPVVVDAQAELELAIRAATSVPQLKAALLGTGGLAKVTGTLT